MSMLKVIAFVVFMYVVVDAVSLGAFNKKLPISVLSLIKGSDNPPLEGGGGSGDGVNSGGDGWFNFDSIFNSKN